MKERNQQIVIWLTLLILTIGSIVLSYFTPFFGDDLAFWNGVGLSDYHGPTAATITFIKEHIVGINGRLFDYMGPVLVFGLPRGLQAVIMGGMVGLYFFAMLLSARIPKSGHVTFTLLFLTATLAVMPWWDNIMRVCQFNYSWGTTFCLFFFYFFFNGKKSHGALSLIGLCVLSLFAGATHEQTAVAMCGAMFCYSLWHSNYKSFTRTQWIMLAGLAIGSLMTVSTPAIWHRAEQNPASLPGIYLLASTLPIYIILLLVCVFTLCKGLFCRLFDAESCVMLIAASLAAAIAAMSGIAGRTGWFSESISLILLARICLQAKTKISNTLAIFLSVCSLSFVCLHFAMSMVWQSKLYHEHEDMVAQFIESNDGIVFLDYTGKKEVPLITLFRVRGVYSPNDTWNPSVISLVYSNDSKKLIVLPSAFKSKLDTITDSLTIDSTTIYRAHAPNTTVIPDSTIIQSWNGMTRYVVIRPEFEVAFAPEKSSVRNWKIL